MKGLISNVKNINYNVFKIPGWRRRIAAEYSLDYTIAKIAWSLVV